MANQRVIAKSLGLTQATVSMALRNSPSIPVETRNRVHAAAKKLGYHPNAYVASLMTHIRSGKPVADKGCIAVLLESPQGKSRIHDTYQRQHQGMINRAESLGFHIEFFHLSDYGMNDAKLNRILSARGISGVILAATHWTIDKINLDWPRYASATVAYRWSHLNMDRASTHHRNQVDGAFQVLLARGYKRIGVCLPPEAIEGVNGAWTDRYLYWQYRLRDTQPVPLFIGRPGDTPATDFRRWLRKWKIDAIVGLIGHESLWLDELGLHAPDDIGLACLNRPLNSRFSGMDENHEVIGETTVELVVNRILHNEYGLPVHPKLILIKGHWVEGETLRKKAA